MDDLTAAFIGWVNYRSTFLSILSLSNRSLASCIREDGSFCIVATLWIMTVCHIRHESFREYQLSSGTYSFLGAGIETQRQWRCHSDNCAWTKSRPRHACLFRFKELAAVIQWQRSNKVHMDKQLTDIIRGPVVCHALCNIKFSTRHDEHVQLSTGTLKSIQVGLAVNGTSRARVWAVQLGSPRCSRHQQKPLSQSVTYTQSWTHLFVPFKQQWNKCRNASIKPGSGHEIGKARQWPSRQSQRLGARVFETASKDKICTALKQQIWWCNFVYQSQFCFHVMDQKWFQVKDAFQIFIDQERETERWPTASVPSTHWPQRANTKNSRNGIAITKETISIFKINVTRNENADKRIDT